jgi:hypothetical protein
MPVAELNGHQEHAHRPERQPEAGARGGVVASVGQANPILALQRAMGNQAVQRLIRANGLPPRAIAGQHATLGNHAVQRLLQRRAGQATHAVDEPGDQDGHAAEQTAESVAGMAESAAAGPLPVIGAEPAIGDRAPTEAAPPEVIPHIGMEQISHSSAGGVAQLTGGDQPGEGTDLVLGGDPATGTAPAPATSAGALGGDASSIGTANLVAPEWKDYGEFKWWIKWTTNGTSGWIVQKIDNTYSGTLADGTAITNATVGAEPSYYEAWEVSSTGAITGSLGATGNRDRWERPRMANGSQGNWGMTGTVYWTSQDPQKSGFKSGGVANAGSLLSSKTAPAGLSAALFNRSAHAMWSSTGAKLLPGCFTTP